MALFSSDKKAKEKRENTGFNGQFSADSDENTNGISTISMETTITGTIETNSVFNMEGVLNGDIKGNKLVHVGKTGQVKGNITAETVVVDGEVSGEIVADKVEIGNTGKVYATITSAVFVIQEGGLFEGRKKIKIALIKEEDGKSKKEIEESFWLKLSLNAEVFLDNLFDDIKDWDTDVQVSYETIEDEETAYFKEQIFNSLIENAKEYYSLTGRYLQIWGELGELYAELEYGLKRHKDVNHEGSDGFINGKLVEVKTISPLKQHNQVVVKKKGSFEQLLIVRISKNFEFKAKLISRDKLNGTTGKFLKGKIK